MRNAEFEMRKVVGAQFAQARSVSAFRIQHSAFTLARFLTVAALTFAGVLATSAVPVLGAEPAQGVEPGVMTAAPGGKLEWVLFNLVAGGLVVSVLGVCISRNIVRMAVWLFICLGSVAMLYFMLAANFLGAIQLIVYAGGTLVLLIFGVMLTSKSPWVRWEAPLVELLAAGVVCAAMLVALCIVLGRTAWTGVVSSTPGASLAAIGEKLLTVYLAPFEVAGVLLMIVMVGAAHMARQEE